MHSDVNKTFNLDRKNLTKWYNNMFNLFFMPKIIKFNLSTKIYAKIHVFVKHYAPGGNKVQKATCFLYF